MFMYFYFFCLGTAVNDATMGNEYSNTNLYFRSAWFDIKSSLPNIVL